MSAIRAALEAANEANKQFVIRPERKAQPIVVEWNLNSTVVRIKRGGVELLALYYGGKVQKNETNDQKIARRLKLLGHALDQYHVTLEQCEQKEV